MSENKNREFDIIIFGATGYTGRYVIEELAHSSKSIDIKWAIAGRNKEKLKESLNIVQEYLGQEIDISKTPIIEANVKSGTSLSNMCERAKLILNCVGPYKLFGEPVIKACLENGTHHVDISGELKFLEGTQIKYFDVAREKNVYIVEACGFDSIPGDYGLTLLKKHFPGDLNSVEYYISVGVGPEGRSTNIGTFLSAIYSFWDTIFVKKADSALKEKLFKEDLPSPKYPLPWRLPPLSYISEEKGWGLWFLGPDERIILRSQLFRHNYLKERPILSHGYVKLSSFFTGLLLIMFAGFFGFMTSFSFGRYLLAKYPSFLTAGVFSSTGPTRKQVMEGSTTFTLYGLGWKEKLSDPTDQHTTKPDTRIKLTIKGPEPGYPLTAMCMVQAGLTILQEQAKLPLEGGVLTPGVAFADTSLKQRLEKRGMTFEFKALN
ncbi:saccharopine dehydrogenase-like oxidoreductase [Parasteatoda tepidariorum]|uniref:saccharopine dehydrogenase-like oxidoreductase n=1 Tax=Parasteatoda tepidariorum TaxID=114398 RepID=UPI00077FE3F3|nr:saccharopine dehydrogenase-like oxidoreductase [Parasteatoda tepidariorum]